MKKLSTYAIFGALLISLAYVIKMYFYIDTEAEFYRASTIALVGYVGLYVLYTASRDYEIVRSREEQMLEFMSKFKSK